MTSKVIVVDADVARSAGESSLAPISKCCRDVLDAMYSICHAIGFTRSIYEEWKRHQSNYSSKWRGQMIARKKFSFDNDDEETTVVKALSSLELNGDQVRLLNKDAKLIGAALGFDGIVISRDDRARAEFSEASRSLGLFGEIMWVNPVAEYSDCLTWLRDGAPAVNQFQLGSYQ